MGEARSRLISVRGQPTFVLPGGGKHQEIHTEDHSGDRQRFNGQGERKANQVEERKRTETGLV